MRDTIVEIAVPIEVHFDLAGFLRRPVHESGQFGFCAGRFFLASQRGFPLTLHDITHLCAHIAVASDIAGIEQAQRAHGLDPFVDL